jgi:hypothetical protein
LKRSAVAIRHVAPPFDSQKLYSFWGIAVLNAPAALRGSALTSACSVGPVDLQRLEINDLLLQETSRPLEIDGNLKSWLFLEALHDSFKADRRNLFLGILEVRKECNFGAGRHRLLESHSGSIDANVMEHALHFYLVVLTIRNLDSDWASNFKSLCIAHRE